MNLRIAILAACAGTLTLTATLAHAGEPVLLGGGITISAKAKIADNNSPLPRDRKAQRQKAGPSPAKPAIFDRWGNSKR